MQIHISPKDGVPIYRQIVNQVKYLVASDRLQDGDGLPPIRTLAQQLLINPNTVARAYRELENDGVVASRQGSGTVVSNGGSPLSGENKVRILGGRVDGLLAEANQMNVSLDSVLDLVRDRYEAMRPTDKERD